MSQACHAVPPRMFLALGEWLVALALVLGASCSRSAGVVDDPILRAERDAGTSAAEAGAVPTMDDGSCAAVSGRCGSSPDVPCDTRERWVPRSGCADLRPCCVPLPLPELGACWGSEDCIGASAPRGRPSSVAQCVPASENDSLEPTDWVPGTCACTQYGAPLPDGRCGPVLKPSEHLVCTVQHVVDGRSDGACGGVPCEAGGTCFLDGDERVSCNPPFLPSLGSFERVLDPREQCYVANCGDFQCDAPLHCVDTARGICDALTGLPALPGP